MSRKCCVLALIALLGHSACVYTAFADPVLVSNLLPDGVVSGNSFSPSVIDATDSWAQEFTSGASVNLASIQASLGRLDAGTNSDFSLTAQLIQVTNASDGPDSGSVVATLSQLGSISTNGFSNVEFAPSVTVSLDASKSYWFVLTGSSSDSTGGVSWQIADTAANSGPGSLPNYGSLSPGDPSWLVFPIDPNNSATFPFLIGVTGQGSAVPEPASLALACIGFAGALFARRWIKSR
jgi:PEP-CTERM motif